MKKITLLMALVVSAFAVQVSAQNPVFEGDGGFINDSSCPLQDEFVADVTGIGVIGDTHQIDEIRLNITHTWAGDLEISLQAPDGETSIALSVQNGGPFEENYTETVFTDEGTPGDITASSPPHTGVFAAQGGSLADAFAGVDATGEWTLLICDAFAGDTGTVDQWSIRFQDNPEMCPAPLNLEVANVMNSSFDISWLAMTNAAEYQYVVMNDGDAPEFANPPAVEADQTADTMATVVALLPATDYDVYVRAICNGVPGPWSAGLDVRTEDLCPAATDLVIGEVENNSIEFSWTAANNSASYDYAVVVSGAAPTYSAADAAFGNVTGTSATATGLTEQTAYDVYVRNNCGATDGVSVDLGPEGTVTGCDTITIAAGDDYSEDFTGAGTTDPQCWTQFGTYVYDYDESDFSGVNGPVVIDNTDQTGTGDYAVVDPAQSFFQNQETIPGSTNLDSPDFDISALEGAAVFFALNSFVDPFLQDNFGVTYNTLNVSLSSDGGASFTEVYSINGPTATSPGNADMWENIIIDLGAEGFTGSTLQVRFETVLDGVFNRVNAIGIDDFSIAELGCLEPQNIAVSDVEATTATLSFDGFSTAVNGFFYAVVEPGVDPEIGPYVASGTLPAGSTGIDLTDLEPLSCYEAYVRSICDGETSGFGTSADFCTPGLCDEPTDVEADNVTNNSVDVSWDAVDGVAGYEYLLVFAGGDPDVAADVVAGTAGQTTDTMVTISDIADGTSYEAYVRSICDEDGNVSVWASSDVFMTLIGCDSDFFDTGGVAADYGNNETLLITLFPSANASALTLEFTSVALEFGEDFLAVYNGEGTSQPFTLDLRAPAVFTSTDPTGAITVRFESDAAGTAAGWEAFTTCSILNDVCATAIELIADEDFDTSATEASNLGATDSGVADPSCGFYGGGDVWYTVVAPESGSLTIETREDNNSSTNIEEPLLVVYSGACGSLTEIACSTSGGEGDYALVSLTGLTAGETLYVRVSGSDSAGLFGDFLIGAYDASLSINDLAASGFNFYPNPVQNELNLTAQENIQTVEVFNLLGQSVAKMAPDALNATLDMSNLNTGVYLVNVTINNQTGAYRIIKQ